MAVAHVVGGLSLDEGRLFRSHLLECTACRARVGELRAIAHDLADVERDERRERAARRTETKAREADDGDAPPPPATRLRGRTTLLLAAGLIILMGLSSWNFVLRGQLQEAESMMALLRESVTVLRDGDQWTIVTKSTEGVDGQVSTLGQDLVVMVDGLVDRKYGLYLLDAAGNTLHRDTVEVTNGMLYEFLDNADVLPRADRLLVVRSEQLMPTPSSGTTIFQADRAVPEEPAQLQPVGGSGP